MGMGLGSDGSFTLHRTGTGNGNEIGNGAFCSHCSTGNGTGNGTVYSKTYCSEQDPVLVPVPVPVMNGYATRSQSLSLCNVNST